MWCRTQARLQTPHKSAWGAGKAETFTGEGGATRDEQAAHGGGGGDDIYEVMRILTKSAHETGERGARRTKTENQDNTNHSNDD